VGGRECACVTHPQQKKILDFLIDLEYIIHILYTFKLSQSTVLEPQQVESVGSAFVVEFAFMI
jgi:hypothetical protein